MPKGRVFSAPFTINDIMNQPRVPLHILDPSSEINIDQLEAVRSKLTQLQESITFFMDGVDPNVAPNATWPEFLSKFNVLLSRNSSLFQSISEQSIHKLVLHPQEPTPPERDHILNILLRTKLIPEIEREEAAIREDVMQQEDLNDPVQDVDPSTASDAELAELERQWQQVLMIWQRKAEEHDRVAQAGEDGFRAVVDGMQLKGRLPPEEPAPKVVMEGVKERSLEDLMTFISSGK